MSIDQSATRLYKAMKGLGDLLKFRLSFSLVNRGFLLLSQEQTKKK